jgi:hypothetical protein
MASSYLGVWPVAVSGLNELGYFGPHQDVASAVGVPAHTTSTKGCQELPCALNGIRREQQA